MDLAAIDPLSLPSLPLVDRVQLPVCPAVYFVLESDRILYIGRSGNLKQRWVIHHRYSQLQRLNNVRIAWLECSDASLLPEIEAALIEYFQPSLNGELIPSVAGKPPRVGAYISLQLKTDLENLAKKEQRTLSNFIAVVLQRVIDEARRKGEID
ncbi:hypothetical protein QUA69_27325 [Microcoleus sp. LAD1_D1]|uniref:hypothetical protein n=1 Tax=Microcoleus sp. LAD1_D1 TaxID=2818812 RepID=UPI002FD1E52B